MSHFLSQTALYTPISPTSRFSYLWKAPISGRNCAKFAVRAADGRENLDHLQKQSRQQPVKKRAAPAVAPIGLWDRFPTARTVQQMMETMERMMDDPLAYNGGWAAPLPAADTVSSYWRGRTPWEIKEGETEYKLRFDMPGMTREDVKVWVEEKMLVLKAEKKTGEGEEWPAKSYGKYNSRIALPENVEFEKIKAEVKDGVLYITIPKASSSAKVFDISVD
ncbi:small heat shock protein, chloroplastic-like [Salvia divinorum]|uniref:Small heat shock protein, chloroplastic-like n=1 Tax=Salvia divinorum TaxID=28513 RepID=A0ABD1G585_SALDI